MALESLPLAPGNWDHMSDWLIDLNNRVGAGGGGSSTVNLAGNTAVGDSSIQISGTIPGEMQAGACIAIGAFTTNCEIRKISGVASNTITLNDAKSITGTSISFDGPTHAITSTSAFSGFFIGNKIIVSGSASNSSTFTITAISTDLKTLTVSETVVTEAAGPTITIKVRLNIAHSSGDRVLWVQGGLVPSEVYGIKTSASTGDASNNTACIQRASNEFTQVGGFAGLYLARGTAYINSTLYLDNGFSLVGSGVDTSIIKATGMTFPDNETVMLKSRNGLLASFGGASSQLSRLYMDGILIDGNSISGSNGALMCMQQPAAWGRVRFINCLGYGLCVTATQDFDITRLEFTGCGIPLRYRGAELVKVRSLNIEQSVTSDFLAEDYGGGCNFNTFQDVHLESSLGAGAKYFDLQSGDGWHFSDVYHSNPDNTGILFSFNVSTGTYGKTTALLENVRANQPSTSFKIVDDVQRSQSLTATQAQRNIQRLDTGLGGSRWAYLLCGNTSGGTNAPPEFPMGIKTSIQTSGTLANTGLASGVGTQISTTRDVMYTMIIQMNPTATNTATCTIALSPDNVTYTQFCNEQMPAGSGITSGNFLRCFQILVPAAWYIKVTVTNATIGGSGGYYW